MNKIQFSCKKYNPLNPPLNFKKGFGATLSVLLISLGTMATSFVVLNEAVSYSDSIFRKEMRIQSGLNSVSCEEAIDLIKAKDIFVSGIVHMSDLNCSLTL